MKKFKNLFLFLLASLVLISCKKDTNTLTSPHTIAGIYEGKFGTGNNTPASFYSFNIKPNGILEEISNTGEVLGTGIWTISGSTFQGSYDYDEPSNNSYSVKATYNASAKNLTNGTWGY
eukprot:gene58173-79673_t